MNVYLDTSALIEIERKAPQALAHQDWLTQQQLCVPHAVRAEFLVGPHLTPKTGAVHRAKRFLAPFKTASLRRRGADVLAQLLAEQVKHGEQHGIFDSIILATAIQDGADLLITQNPKHFATKQFDIDVRTFSQLSV